MIGSLIISDIKNGVYANRKKIGLFALYILFVTIGECAKSMSYQNIRMGVIGVMITKLLKGISFFSIKANEGIEGITLPAGWLISAIFVVYILGDYVYKDLFDVGLYKMVYVGRIKWWFSKIIYSLFMAGIYLLIFWGVPFAVTIYFNDMHIPKIKNESWIYLGGYSDLYANKSAFYTYLIVIPVLCIISLVVWYTVLSIIITPTKTFIIMVSYLTIGIYWTSPYFIGNQLMLIRCQDMTEGGLNPVTSILMDVVLIVFGIIIGSEYIKKRDMLDN